VATSTLDSCEPSIVVTRMMCVVVWTAAAGPRSGFPTDSAGARVKQSYRQKTERSGDRRRPPQILHANAMRNNCRENNADLPAKLIGSGALPKAHAADERRARGQNPFPSENWSH